MLRIESLEIDDHILEKIESKHGISTRLSRPAFRIGRISEEEGKASIRSSARPQPDGNVLVVLVNLGQDAWRIATAREMTDGERRLYIRVRGSA